MYFTSLFDFLSIPSLPRLRASILGGQSHLRELREEIAKEEAEHAAALAAQRAILAQREEQIRRHKQRAQAVSAAPPPLPHFAFVFASTVVNPGTPLLRRTEHVACSARPPPSLPPLAYLLCLSYS